MNNMKVINVKIKVRHDGWFAEYLYYWKIVNGEKSGDLYSTKRQAINSFKKFAKEAGIENYTIKES